jgi:hypothetical protein
MNIFEKFKIKSIDKIYIRDLKSGQIILELNTLKFTQPSSEFEFKFETKAEEGTESKST